jgi:7-cyano-7-deazaguanine reductase
MTEASKSLLGKETDYTQMYSPDLLFPLARKTNRESIHISSTLPFHGEDIWTGYELSWLNHKGKPVVAIADFHFPADSEFMIESKSFKLYLNSLNHECFDSHEKVKVLLEKDLAKASGAQVKVNLIDVNSHFQTTEQSDKYLCLDNLDIDGFEYQPNAALLNRGNSKLVSEYLYSHLLRSNCPVTGQPDWASIYIDYTGPKIQHESLLKYIVSFRQCQDFHEHCVERIFTDLMAKCQCRSLSVYARYTRRGGLDINPYRASFDRAEKAPVMRTARQ